MVRGQVEEKRLTGGVGEGRESPGEDDVMEAKRIEFQEPGRLQQLNWVECYCNSSWHSPLEEQKSPYELKGEWNKEMENTCEVNPFEKNLD